MSNIETAKAAFTVRNLFQRFHGDSKSARDAAASESSVLQYPTLVTNH